MMCRHCTQFRASRPRQLRWRCYHDRQIRSLYPGSTSKFQRRGTGTQANGKPRPTQTPRGTLAKIIVLSARAAKGEELWHADDTDAAPGASELFVAPGSMPGGRR